MKPAGYLKGFLKRMRACRSSAFPPQADPPAVWRGRAALNLRKAQAPPFWEQEGWACGMALLAGSLWARTKRAGQVTVELLLALPVFMLILFFIMEIGNLAYQTILVHHCAYELARIGSLVAGPNGGGYGGGNENSKMKDILKEMLPNATLDPLPSREPRSYGPDPQSAATYIGEDLKVTLTYPAKLVFPGSSCFLSDGFPPKCTRIKSIVVTVWMPIEKPFFQ